MTMNFRSSFEKKMKRSIFSLHIITEGRNTKSSIGYLLPVIHEEKQNNGNCLWLITETIDRSL